MRLTPRDAEIFKKAVQCRAMESFQIFDLYFSLEHPSRGKTRLLFLTKEKIIKRVEQYTIFSDGKKPYVYTPHADGIEIIATYLGYSRQELLDQLHWDGKPLLTGQYFLPHILHTAEVNVQLSKAADKYKFSLDWYNDLSLNRKEMRDWFEIVDTEGIRQKVSLVPDAYAILTTSETDFRFLIEVDKGTETLKDIANKIIKYLYYLASQENNDSIYKRRFGTHKGRVLFTCESLPRLLSIKKVCEEVGGRARFWFAVLSDLKANDPLYSPIWRRAGSDEVLSLLSFS